MIERDLAPRILDAARAFPAVTVTGPRQSGKSTLCRALFPSHAYVNLEAPDTRRFAVEDPRAFLARYADGAVLDEIQRAPELTSYLQPVIDEDPEPGRWILTGSQNLTLIEAVSQSLAGRTAMLNLLPLTLQEIHRFPRPPQPLDDTVFAGGYPPIFDRGIPPAEWLSAYVATYVERDVRLISNIGDLAAFQRFMALCAGRTGQLLNYSSLATDAGVSQPTAKAWVSVLEASFIVLKLPAWSGNVRKRLVKMPKLHFLDSGLACWLLGIRSPEQLSTYPLRGSIFESWVVAEFAKHRANRGERGGLYFYRDRSGVEADLLIDGPSGPTIVEVKSGQTVTSDFIVPIRRIRDTFTDPADRSPVIVYGGESMQKRSNVTLVPWNSISTIA